MEYVVFSNAVEIFKYSDLIIHWNYVEHEESPTLFNDLPFGAQRIIPTTTP